MVDPDLHKAQVRNRNVLFALSFIMGGCGIAYEYTYSKISSDLMGNSVQQWALTIGFMMFFMGIGSDWQKYFPDRNLFDRFIFFEILLGILGGFGPMLLLWTFGVARDYYAVVQYGLICTTGFLIGVETPIVARINEQYSDSLKVNIGGILRMDYIGAFLGAICWVFLFLQWFGISRIGFALGILNLVAAGLALFHFRKMAHYATPLALFALTCTVSLVVGFVKAPEWSIAAEQHLFEDRIIHAETTRYQHIVLTQGPDDVVSCYINGNTQFTSFDEHIYHEFLVHPAMQVAPQHKRVLILGAGDGLGLREVLKYPNLEEVVLVDLDPAMTRLASQHPLMVAMNDGAFADSRLKTIENVAFNEKGERTINLKDQNQWFGPRNHAIGRVSVLNVDAARYVAQAPGFFDVIIIDFPDPNNLDLAKLYSLEFYRNVLRKLARGGILVQQSTSPVLSREAFLCIGRTLNAAGFAAVPFHENVPAFGDWGWWIAGDARYYDEGELMQGLHSVGDIPVDVRHITPELIQASTVFGKNELVTDQTEINTILTNAIYFYYSAALVYHND
jgi:spermidine synthase